MELLEQIARHADGLMRSRAARLEADLAWAVVLTDYGRLDRLHVVDAWVPLGGRPIPPAVACWINTPEG